VAGLLVRQLLARYGKLYPAEAAIIRMRAGSVTAGASPSGGRGSVIWGAVSGGADILPIDRHRRDARYPAVFAMNIVPTTGCFGSTCVNRRRSLNDR